MSNNRIKSALVTGSAGLIGSAVCRRLAEAGYQIHGVDNNMRRFFFGEAGDTLGVAARLELEIPYRHHKIDIRDRRLLDELVEASRPEIIVHAAAQPSHDLSAQMPLVDFEVNAVGTLNLLDAARTWCPEAPFIFMSTNKVYGDRPNTIPMIENDKRWCLDSLMHGNGISEGFPIDDSTHSPFGASKLAADIMVQEYGRYFGMPTVCLRGGCLTGPAHQGVELHGFLSYLIKCNAEGKQYTVYGYKGKQVRDNIHAADVADFILQFAAAPRRGEVYNIGGGYGNSCSILEAFEWAHSITGKKQVYTYVDAPRVGDHMCYYSDLTKARRHYPNWEVRRSLASIFEEIALRWMRKEVTA